MTTQEFLILKDIHKKSQKNLETHTKQTIIQENRNFPNEPKKKKKQVGALNRLINSHGKT